MALNVTRQNVLRISQISLVCFIAAFFSGCIFEKSPEDKKREAMLNSFTTKITQGMEERKIIEKKISELNAQMKNVSDPKEKGTFVNKVMYYQNSLKRNAERMAYY